MLQMETFVRDDVLPSWFANALTRALSVLASQFQLVRLDATHVQLIAGADAGAAVLAVGGMWRWVEGSISVAHPGGVAGTYPIFATAKNNNITSSPLPYSDDTDYSFRLTVVAPGHVPAIVAGVVDVYRQVGNAVWDGAQITRVDQLVPPAVSHAGRHIVGGPDVLTPAMIGAVPSGDATTGQPGDLIISAALTRTGCVLCDGTAYSRTATLYAPLFAKIGTRYGPGDGSTTFNVPDFRDRVIVGAGAGPGLTSRALGDKGGEETHHLTEAELPNYTLPKTWANGVPLTASTGAGSYAIEPPGGTGFALVDNTDVTVTSGGSDVPHNNMQPFGVANVFIHL